ncbi:MAG: hypothetical protein A2086_15140 [Spirochaetes bacterium GWD1_27_9]|nr:MAG: hypothetical protein A2Z98_00155 [Spirochaetes bacterium GWB1_27_13]OHD31099.1 MAG: hypothetical protein A2086_15140 [Spirochaetes bacterium GWD1_27_9]
MDVIIGKIESISRCLTRINEEYAQNDDNLSNITKQDSIILNIQRACELSIDIGNFIISKYKFATPRVSKEVFDILYENKVISQKILLNLQKMVGFRNIAIHDYKKLDLNIIKLIINNNLNDFRDFCEEILGFLKK